MAAAKKYTLGPGSAEDPDAEVKRRAAATRRCIGNIQQHPVLSTEWLASVNALEELVGIMQFEMATSPSVDVSKTQGRDSESDGTLWDQGQQENTILILVEEAKINVLVQLLGDFKRWDFQRLSEDKVRPQQARCQQFEEYMGLVLHRCFLHLEALQVTDVPVLLEHCAYVLERCQVLCLDAGANLKMQETMALRYLGAVTKHAESLRTADVLLNFRELQLVRLVTEHTLRNADAYPLEVLSIVAFALASLAENEDFLTQWEDFFVGDGGTKALFLQLEERVVQPVIGGDLARRSQLRPLLDFLRILARAVG